MRHSATPPACATFLFLSHFDVICDLLVNRRTATWNLFVKCTHGVLNKMTCAVLKKLQNFRQVLCKFLLRKFRQCKDYFEQSKPYFEPLTFVWKRCLLQREYFEFVSIFIEYFYFVCLRFNYISKTQTLGNKSERKKFFLSQSYHRIENVSW